MSAILEVRNLNTFTADGVPALKNVSFSVERGEFLVILGARGSGKSTLLRCINRFIEPSSGEIVFDGIDLTALSLAQLRRYRKRIGMVFQHFNHVKRRTVLTNVVSGTLGAASTWSSLLERFSEEDEARALERLEVVGLVDEAQSPADELSDAQQQRLAIARTLMQNPDILLADEPAVGLDADTSHAVMRPLKDANAKMGKTVICNHRVSRLAREYGTRVIALEAGSIVFDGAAEQIDEDGFERIYADDALEVEIGR